MASGFCRFSSQFRKITSRIRPSKTPMKLHLERYSEKPELKREVGSGESVALNVTIGDLHGGDVSQGAVSPKVARGAPARLVGGKGYHVPRHSTHTTVPTPCTRSVSAVLDTPQLCFASLCLVFVFIYLFFIHCPPFLLHSYSFVDFRLLL